MSPEVETRHVSFACHELHFGIECFQQRTLAAADASDQVDEFAGADRQVDVCEHQFAAGDDFGGRRVAEGIVGVVYAYVLQSDDGRIVHGFQFS